MASYIDTSMENTNIKIATKTVTSMHEIDVAVLAVVN